MTSKKHKFQITAEKFLESAGIAINGSNPWDMTVHDDRLYARVFAEGSLGLGEAYMDGWWDSQQLDELIARCMAGRLTEQIPRNLKTLMLHAQARFANRQTKSRSFIAADVHYDLGNDLFAGTFDSRLTGSCGYWAEADELDAAQDAKLDLICKKIGLKQGDRVFDIGCGWGAFMGFAAEKYGAICEGVTVSKEQVSYIHERYAELPVKATLADYRDAEGEFDHVVSMGMFEHVGPKNYRTYFETAHRLLKEDGFFLLHTIGGQASVSQIEPWLDKYIFPNGVLPSLKQVGEAIEGLFMVEDLHNFGADYDRTLMAWHHKFESNWPALSKNYDERFRRMWNYYLLSCAGGFRARHIQLWHFVLAKRGIAGGYTSVR